LPALSAQKDAVILATLSKQKDKINPYPLIAWQKYGKGKTMYVGADQLWRMRSTAGDQYHAQFWSAAIRLMTVAEK
jgi:hypothetical protein